MLTTQHIQESLSRSYIHAIAGSAGVNLRAGSEFDYGFDGTFRPVVYRGKRRVESGFPIDFQLKCTKNWEHKNDKVAYSVETKTYNDLVTRDPNGLGALLILFCIPESQSQWLEMCENYMTLRHCCYYMALSGQPVPKEESTKKILIPRKNVLTAVALNELLDAERTRKLSGRSS